MKQSAKQLRAENQFLHAMLHKCLRCHRESDPGDLVKFEVFLDNGKYRALAYWGGAVSSMGSFATERQAMASACAGLVHEVKRESARALKEKPWRALAEPTAKRRRRT